jgi:adenosylcobinamide-GDP ribazoletransferase
MFRAGLRPVGALVALALGAAIAVALLGVAGLVAFGLTVLAAVALGWFATRRLGGVTGDVMGATIEIAELIVLLTFVAWTHPPR